MNVLLSPELEKEEGQAIQRSATWTEDCCRACCQCPSDVCCRPEEQAGR